MSKKVRELDLMIIGAGPAGLTAAIYGSRANLNMLLLEDAIVGGQVRASYTIENYPGFKKIEGSTLADLIQEQAVGLGAEIDEFDLVERVVFSDEEKIVETSSYIYKPAAVIISTGAVPKKIPVANEQKYAGKGIHYCAVCDGAMYSGKTIGVVGGGNSALEEALFLSRFAEKVIMIRRFDYFNGERSTLDEVLNNAKIEIMYNWDLVDVYGENFINMVKIKNTLNRGEKEIKMDAVFGYIGTEPKTELFKEYLNLNKQGYIITDENMRTNIKGVYGAGDVREKAFRQITTAVADGTIAALDAERYITEKRRGK